MSINTGYKNFIDYSLSSYNSNSSNNTKSSNLTTYKAISEEMGLNVNFLHTIKKADNHGRRYLNRDEYEKIKEFFQKHLSYDSINLLEPFDPSKLSRRLPEKLAIEESLRQKIMGGAAEIIENATQSQATVINHSSEKSGSNNNKKCIDLTNEENHHDQNSIVNHPPKKAKTTSSIHHQPSTFHQNAIPMYQSFFLEKAFLPKDKTPPLITRSLSMEQQTFGEDVFLLKERMLPTDFDDFQQPPAPGLTTPIDDLFYNIPDDMLFLPEEPVQTSSTDRQAAIQESSVDDLFLFVPDTDDVFKLESTWDD